MPQVEAANKNTSDTNFVQQNMKGPGEINFYSKVKVEILGVLCTLNYIYSSFSIENKRQILSHERGLEAVKSLCFIEDCCKLYYGECCKSEQKVKY